MWNIGSLQMVREALLGKLSLEEVVQKCVAELLGTTILLFLGCLAGGISKYGQDTPFNYFISTFNFGLAVMTTILVVGHISDCHINPVVTLACLVLGLIKPGLAALYTACQLVGAVLGYGLLYMMASKLRGADSSGFCVTQVHEDVGVWEAVGLEAAVTTVLCFVVCSAFDPRNASKSDSVPIKFGLTVSCLAVAESAFTGCSMNPARSLGPSVWTGNWKNHWVYWVGPVIGSLLAASFYKCVFYIPQKSDEDVKLDNNKIEKGNQER